MEKPTFARGLWQRIAGQPTDMLYDQMSQTRRTDMLLSGCVLGGHLLSAIMQLVILHVFLFECVMISAAQSDCSQFSDLLHHLGNHVFSTDSFHAL